MNKSRFTQNTVRTKIKIFDVKFRVKLSPQNLHFTIKLHAFSPHGNSNGNLAQACGHQAMFNMSQGQFGVVTLHKFMYVIGLSTKSTPRPFHDAINSFPQMYIF